VAAPVTRVRDILFIQGAGEGAHSNWDIHLVESLRRELGPSYEVRYPEMPDEADPTVATWRPVLERELAALRPGSVVLGHSVGGTMLIHVLADAAPTSVPAAVMLISAPFIGDGGWPSEEIAPFTDLARRVPDAPIFLYHGLDDAEVPVSHADRYAAALPQAHVRRLAGRDHQLNNDLSEVARDIRALDAHAAGGP
jgi:predicted alpha/beta hydrolase family esterase